MTTHAETPAETIARLETNIAAAQSNHKLLAGAGPAVNRNNQRLRSGLERVAAGIAGDTALTWVTDRLSEAARRPVRHPQPQPPEFHLPDDDGPQDEAGRIAWLEERLRLWQHANYLEQAAGSPIVWNSDGMRDAITAIRRDLLADEEGENGRHDALIAELDAVLDAGRDRKQN